MPGTHPTPPIFPFQVSSFSYITVRRLGAFDFGSASINMHLELPKKCYLNKSFFPPFPTQNQGKHPFNKSLTLASISFFCFPLFFCLLHDSSSTKCPCQGTESLRFWQTFRCVAWAAPQHVPPATVATSRCWVLLWQPVAAAWHPHAWKTRWGRPGWRGRVFFNSQKQMTCLLIF